MRNGPQRDVVQSSPTARRKRGARRTRPEGAVRHRRTKPRRAPTPPGEEQPIQEGLTGNRPRPGELGRYSGGGAISRCASDSGHTSAGLLKLTPQSQRLLPGKAARSAKRREMVLPPGRISSSPGRGMFAAGGGAPITSKLTNIEELSTLSMLTYPRLVERRNQYGQNEGALRSV